MSEANYDSGSDYTVDFFDYSFNFNATDFEQRVNAAAVRLGLIGTGECDPEEIADLVELVADGGIGSARSPFGEYIVREWDRVSAVGSESLVYWLRKLVFRSAWLDHRVKEGLLDVSWEECSAEFSYRNPKGGAALLELAPVPSWHAVGYRPR